MFDRRVDYGVAALPGYNGDHETISGPDLYMMFDRSGPRAAAALKFITWLTSSTAGTIKGVMSQGASYAFVADRNE